MGKEKTRIAEIVDLLWSLYDFRRNELSNKLECKPKDSSSWAEVITNDIWLKIAKIKDSEIYVIENILASPSFAPSYNPFKEWVERLPIPQNEEEVFRKLAGYIVLTKNDSYEKSRLVLGLKKWFVSAIRAVYDPEFVPKHCLVLIGEQGIGKTPFLRNFMPPHLKGSELDNPMARDTERLTESLMGFIEEVNAWLRLDANEPRHQQFLSTPGTKRKRITSLLASAGSADFLKREGGTDRFVCFKIDKIWNYRRIREDKELRKSRGERPKNLDPAEEADITSVWAAAFKLYKGGYEAQYSTTETKWNRRSNKIMHAATNSNLEIFYRFFEPKSPGDTDATFVNTTELANILNEKQAFIKYNPYSLGKLLGGEGIKRYRIKDQYGYYVAFLDE